MTAQTGLPNRPPLQSCPICGLAMIAHKSRPDSAAYDLFQCLACETELRLAGGRGSPAAQRQAIQRPAAAVRAISST
jgi:hypothetical protein